MRGIHKLAITLTIGGTVLFSSIPFAQAHSLEEKITLQKEEIFQIKTDMETLQSDIQKLSSEIEKVQGTLAETTAHIKELKEEIEEKEAEIARLEDSIEKRIEILKDRAVAIQQQNRTNLVVDVLLNSKNISDLLQNVASLNALFQSDTDIMEQLAQEQAQVASEKEAVQAHQAELEKKEQSLEAQKADLEKKEAEKDKALHALQDKLDTAAANLETTEQELASQIEAAAKLVAQAQANSNVSGAPNVNHQVVANGQFAWPAVGGVITSYQGPRWGRFHKGIDIAGVSNRTILATMNGTVVSAGWMSGYGNTVVISHADGYQSLYAHLDAIHVSSGQSVAQGEQIGIMGTTGNSTGVHLHFEVTQNGTLLNPATLLGR